MLHFFPLLLAHSRLAQNPPKQTSPDVYSVGIGKSHSYLPALHEFVTPAPGRPGET